MDYLERFTIPIQGMNIGVHEYQFSIDSEFFSYFEDSLISKGSYNVDVQIERKERMLVLNFEIEGTFNSNCDRCLAKIDIPSLIDYRVYLKYGLVEKDFSLIDVEDVIYISEEDYKYNLSNIIHQLISLSMPLSNTYDCEKDENPKCDFEMLEYLNTQNDEDSDNLEEKNSESSINPIWEKLKKDFNKN